MPKIGPFRAVLDDLLAANDAKPSRERLTLIRVFEVILPAFDRTLRRLRIGL
jgi:hypothetical protein